MGLKSSRAGKLLLFSASFVMVSSFAAPDDADGRFTRILFWLLTAVAVGWFLRLETAGVFDRDGGVVVKRVVGRPVMFPAAANPVASFTRRRLGYQLVIRADRHAPVPTGSCSPAPTLNRTSSSRQVSP